MTVSNLNPNTSYFFKVYALKDGKVTNVDTYNPMYTILTRKSNPEVLELKLDKEFYNKCSNTAKQRYEECYSQKVWTENIKEALEL